MTNDKNQYAYDKAKWHYGADNFPSNQPNLFGFVHTGFFLTWLAENGLLSSFVLEESAAEVKTTIDRLSSPIALYEVWDGVLCGDMLNEKGNKFALWYYERKYFSDYAEVFFESECIYSVNPSWENYDLIKLVISKKYNKWIASKDKKIWQFWR